MSELITNLNAIYNTKLQIKAALNTDSDNFADYPAYISALGPTVSGYSYITTNGDFDISTYAMVNVNVPQGGGDVDYQWVDMGTSPVLTQGDKVSFNGCLGSGDQVTQDIINVYPGFADYLGWYMYPVGGRNGSYLWEKYVLSENQLSISQNSGVVVSGEILDIATGSATQKVIILEDIKETKYAGGNGTKDITTNGTQLVVGYQSVSVNVTPQRNHDGLSEATAFTVDEAIEFINILDPNTPTSEMFYVKGRISQVIYTFSEQYSTWRGYISDDGIMYNDQTASDNVDHSKELFIYTNGYGPEYQTVNWDENVKPQVKVGDSVVVYANLQLWTDSKISRKPQTNNGYLANHQRTIDGNLLVTDNNTTIHVGGYQSVSVNVQGSGTVLSNPTISYTETAGGLYCNIHHNDGDFTVVEYISPEALGPNILDGFNVGPFNTPYTVDVYNMAFNGMNQPGYSRFIVTRNEPDWSQGTCFFCDIDADPSDSSNRTYLTNFSYNFGTLDVDQTITKKFYLEYNNINYAINNWYSLNIHESTSPASDNYTIDQFDGHFEFSNTGENTVPGYNLNITFDVINKLFTITWSEYEL